MFIWHWLTRLSVGLLAFSRTPAHASINPLTEAVDRYQAALSQQNLLLALLARDQVDVALQKCAPPDAIDVTRLIELDAQLRKCTATLPLEDLPQWRQSLHPSATPWWWALDHRPKSRERWPWILLKGFLWVCLGVLWVLTASLGLEIVKRFLVGAPDGVSFVGTILTLFVAGGSLPLSKLAGSFIQGAFKTWPKPGTRSTLLLMFSLVTGTVFAGWLILSLWLRLPEMALGYNNDGLRALQEGNLTAAKQDFQRAAALDPDHVAPFYNLAYQFQESGLGDEALEWYQKAIENDLNFGAAYAGMGYVCNLQGEFERAEQVMLAGLVLKYREKDAEFAEVTRYRLLSYLGWTYFAQEKYGQAEAILREAIGQERHLKTLEEQTGQTCLSALPHYYLAQVYEQQDRAQEAIQQWRESKRFLVQDKWMDRGWILEADSHIANLEGKK